MDNPTIPLRSRLVVLVFLVVWLGSDDRRLGQPPADGRWDADWRWNPR
jgi:hypothetical protein